MEKRGQASMEFLMTYGWAILAAVIAVGVLAYYGVFNQSSAMPNTCLISAPLGCDEHLVNDTGVRVIVRNGAGSGVTISNITVSGCGSDTSGISISDASTSDIFIACDSATTVGEKFSGDITVTYTRAGKTIAETATGSVKSTVQ